MNYYILISVVVLFLALSFGYWFFFVKAQYENGYVVLGGERFEVELAKSVKQQAQGLSGKESLGEREGMIFLYNKPSKPAFWMKGMNFSIDIIWIREGVVVGFIENAKPESYFKNKIFKPESEIDMVLEINSGVIQDLDIKVGEKIETVL